jgi:hypothetical protein
VPCFSSDFCGKNNNKSFSPIINYIVNLKAKFVNDLGVILQDFFHKIKKSPEKGEGGK